MVAFENGKARDNLVWWHFIDIWQFVKSTQDNNMITGKKKKKRLFWDCVFFKKYYYYLANTNKKISEMCHVMSFVVSLDFFYYIFYVFKGTVVD